MTDLRCERRLHGRLLRIDGRPVLEISCRSALCGKRDGVVVLHYWSCETGELLNTKRFKEVPHGLGQRAAVRHA